MNWQKLTRTLATPIAAGFLLASCYAGEPRDTRPPRPEATAAVPATPPLPAGKYPIQNVSYDDATGNYSVFVLGAPAGHKPLFRSPDVKMARLPDDAIAAGEKSHVAFDESGAATLFLTEDFQIAYVHNVVEERVDPSGQREAVVVRQETSTWSPFVSAMAGAAIGNMLFAPRYYHPPPYSGGALAGYGAVGPSRDVATQQYTQRFGREPQAAQLRRTGMTPRPVAQDSVRSTGRGASSSRFDRSSRPTSRPKPMRGFGFGRRR
ncbi:hypothetical protein L6R52_39080 [Myxococcota bacterium]|nr:hypothetical protein [Myxococcota bacterium]